MDNLYRSTTGFLINKQVVEVKRDKNKVLKEIEFFSKICGNCILCGGVVIIMLLSMGGLRELRQKSMTSTDRGEISETIFFKL